MPWWSKRVLVAAALYNLIWGSWVVFRPGDLFRMTGTPEPLYPSIWQCVGMVVGVYGIGYAIAARDPLRHWPIVLVGLLGKLLGPLGFGWMWLTMSADDPGRLPPSWGLMLLTNDVIWWLPFAALLYHSARNHLAPAGTETLSLAAANERFRDQHGVSLVDLSTGRSCLVVFLRHSGCTFCRQTLADLQAQRERLRAAAVNPVLVHMGDDAAGEKFFGRYAMADLSRISDPSCTLYRAYGLGRGRFTQLLGPAVWWPGFKAILAGHAIGPPDGDGFQMPGAFLIRDGKVVKQYRHTTSAGRPDYCRLVESPAA